MNTEVQAYLQWSLEALEQAEGWALEQAPMVLQEAYRWLLWRDIVGVALSLTLVVCCVLVIERLLQQGVDTLDELPFIVVILCGFGGVSGAIVLLVATHDLLKLILAPRVYLLDYVRGFIGG